MKNCNALLLAGTLLLWAAGGHAQSAPAAAAAPARPAALCDDRLQPAGLYGRWQVRILAGTNTGTGTDESTLELFAHPEDTGRLRGWMLRNGIRVAFAGELDENGQLVLEESEDGTHISGNWELHAVPGQCARLLEGEWADARQPEQADLRHAVQWRQSVPAGPAPRLPAARP